MTKMMLLVIVTLLVVGMVQGQDTSRRYIDEWAVKLADEADPHAIAIEHGFKYIPTKGLPRGYFKFGLDKSRDVVHTHNVGRMETHPHVHSVHRQHLQKRVRRGFPESPQDPMWSDQWHLHGASSSLMPQSTWEAGIDGTGVTLAIVDDGLDHFHDDVKHGYSAISSYDFNGNDPDPRSLERADTHGTKAAGCAGAASNSKCGLGVAPMVSLAGIRLISYDTTDLQEAQGLSYRTDINDIYSNSWGPTDDGNRLEGAGPVLMAAFKQSVEEGRGGKGSVYIWASGNGAGRRDTCNYDGYANARYTIPIGAIDTSGKSRSYSEGCSAIYAVVPSEGIRTINVNNKCTTGFGGTSAASPIAAGLMALVLHARPELTWRDVQHVVARSAVKTDPAHPDWIVNGAGFHFNWQYGFGRLDANATVSYAQRHTLVPKSKTVDTDWVYPNTTIPDTGTEVSILQAIKRSGIDYVEHVDLYVQGNHKHRGEVRIALVSPSGTESVLQANHADRHSGWDSGNTGEPWRFASVANWGEAADGDWRITLKDETPGNQDAPATLQGYRLVVYGFKRRGSSAGDSDYFVIEVIVGVGILVLLAAIALMGIMYWRTRKTDSVDPESSSMLDLDEIQLQEDEMVDVNIDDTDIL